MPDWFSEIKNTCLLKSLNYKWRTVCMISLTIYIYIVQYCCLCNKYTLVSWARVFCASQWTQVDSSETDQTVVQLVDLPRFCSHTAFNLVPSISRPCEASSQCACGDRCAGAWHRLAQRAPRLPKMHQSWRQPSEILIYCNSNLCTFFLKLCMYSVFTCIYY